MRGTVRTVVGLIRRVVSTSTPASGAALALLLGAVMPPGAAVPGIGVLSPGVAPAQTSAPSYVTVAADGTLLRCGAGSAYYAVARLERGQVLVSGGTESDWVRVEYPPGLFAFVAADQVTLDEAGRTATLRQESALRAANLAGTVKGSWRRLLERPLPAGTALDVVEQIKGDDGTVVALRVRAPRGAFGYVQPQSVRPATDAEVQAFLAAHPGDAGLAHAPDAGASTATSDPASTGGVPATAPAGTSLVEPIVLPGSEGPAPARTEGTAPADLVQDTSTAGPTGAAPAEPARGAATIDDLEVQFARIRREGGDDAQIDELVSEYERILSTIGETGRDRRLRAALQQRIELLRLQQSIAATLRAARSDSEAASEQVRLVAARAAELDRNRSYNVVGRLVPSTIYDGKRLPLMYRLVSVGQDPARTLGYLKPGEGMVLDDKVGLVVGVIGPSTIDRSLNLNIVHASRVDVLAPSLTGQNTAPAPGTPGGPPASDAPIVR